MSSPIEYEEITEDDDLPEVDLASELDAETPELEGNGVEDSFVDDEPEDGADGSDQDQGEGERAKSKNECRSEARMLVNTFDQLQLSIFQYAVYPNVILKKGDYQRVEHHRETRSGIIDEETQAAIDRWIEFERKCKELPLSKEEKDRIIDPLSKMLHKWQRVEVSPEMTLIFVLCLVMLPRLQPVFPLLFKKLDGMFR